MGRMKNPFFSCLLFYFLLISFTAYQSPASRPFTPLKALAGVSPLQ